MAEYESFFPMLYIIESEKVKNKCMEVSVADRASDNAVEYKVEDLTENEFVERVWTGKGEGTRHI